MKTQITPTTTNRRKKTEQIEVTPLQHPAVEQLQPETKLKETTTNKASSWLTILTGSFSLVAGIAGTVIYFETNYAHAGDVQRILDQQQQQIKLYERSQRQNSLFQLEYYDSRIRQLNDELARTEQQSTPQGARVLGNQQRNSRTSEEVQNEINDLKQRREFVRKNMITE